MLLVRLMCEFLTEFIGAAETLLLPDEWPDLKLRLSRAMDLQMEG